MKRVSGYSVASAFTAELYVSPFTEREGMMQPQAGAPVNALRYTFPVIQQQWDRPRDPEADAAMTNVMPVSLWVQRAGKGYGG